MQSAPSLFLPSFRCFTFDHLNCNQLFHRHRINAVACQLQLLQGPICFCKLSNGKCAQVVLAQIQTLQCRPCTRNQLWHGFGVKRVSTQVKAAGKAWWLKAWPRSQTQSSGAASMGQLARTSACNSGSWLWVSTSRVMVMLLTCSRTRQRSELLVADNAVIAVEHTACNSGGTVCRTSTSDIDCAEAWKVPGCVPLLLTIGGSGRTS